MFDINSSHETLPWTKSSAPYPCYVEAERDRLLYDPKFGINAGNQYQYIDVFAYACRHESTHERHFNAWWSPVWVFSADLDQDAMPASVEQDEGLNPMLYSTHPAPTGIRNWSDDQYYTLLIEPYLEPGILKHADWAHPGSNWP